MRCPQCSTENEDGAAFCEMCAEPLTAYGGQVTGLVSDATLAKLERMRRRPIAIPALLIFDSLVVVLGPLAGILGRLKAQPALNAENTNYIGHAFGAVNTALAALVLIPVGIVLLYLAFGTWTQRTWAWGANAALLGMVGLMGVFGIGLAGPLRFLSVVAAAGLLVLWLRPETREWYGAQ